MEKEGSIWDTAIEAPLKPERGLSIEALSGIRLHAPACRRINFDLAQILPKIDEILCKRYLVAIFNILRFIRSLF